MITAKNADVEAIRVSAVEGAPTYGGDLLVKPLLRGDEMTALEIFYGAGVGTSPHAHAHESMVYIVRGRVKSVVGGQEFILSAGDTCRHPTGVQHSMEALEDSLIVEVKAPAPDVSRFFATRGPGA